MSSEEKSVWLWGLRKRKFNLLFGAYVYVDSPKGFDLPHTCRSAYTKGSKKSELNIFYYQSESIRDMGKKRGKDPLLGTLKSSFKLWLV